MTVPPMARLVVGLLLLWSACGADDDTSIRVLAASSLTDAFEALAEAFAATEAAGGMSVELSFAGSATLAAQLEEGAPADVVATADEATMARVVESGRAVAPPQLFATNELTIAVHPSATAEVAELADLGDDEVLVALCAPQVPCGALSGELLAAAGVEVDPATNEPNVRSVLTKVVLGEVDAGLVYRTDLAGAEPDDVVERPTGVTDAPRNRYPIAALSDDAAAQAFVEFVRSPAGQTVLASFGFEAARP